jgi:hypothetical protein
MAGRPHRSGELVYAEVFARRRMKLVADRSQFAALPDPARERWERFVWRQEADTRHPETPTILPSIGLMLEYLRERGRERAVLHDWVSFGYQEVPELCDWLWQAVAALLEAG